MQSAEVAARSVADEIAVRVVDSRSVTLGLGMIAVACARRAAGGGDVDEIAALATDLASRTRVFGALDTLENLKKGGRIGNAKALLATALAIKPIIEVVDGKVEQGGKQRTRSKALAFLVDKVREYEGRMSSLAVLHADCSDVDEFVAMLRPLYARRDRRRRDRSGHRHPRRARHDRCRLHRVVATTRGPPHRHAARRNRRRLAIDARGDRRGRATFVRECPEPGRSTQLA